MGKRGPKPEPTILRVMKGNPSKRPLNDREPEAPIGVPDCPHWLDKVAKDHWKKLAPQLAGLGTMSPNYLTNFAAYCQAWADFKEAVIAVRKEGRFFTTAKGYVLPHPMVSQKNKAMELLAKLGSLFGLNPSSQSGIKATPPGRKEDDELEQMLNEVS